MDVLCLVVMIALFVATIVHMSYYEPKDAPLHVQVLIIVGAHCAVLGWLPFARPSIAEELWYQVLFAIMVVTTVLHCLLAARAHRLGHKFEPDISF
jgi:hypothetical protein